MKKIRVGAVSYLNTKPLLFGITNHKVINEIELVTGYPAKIAQMLAADEIDVGLLPVAAAAKLHNWHVVGDYCIGSDGPVASVAIFSEVPMEKIETVLLDYQSRTSVNLARILLADHWKQQVNLVETSGEDYREKIEGGTAGVVIGDRALQQLHQSTYSYDLGQAWKAYTGLPFVFASWIANKELPAAFEEQFNQANALGVQAIPEVAAKTQCAFYDLEKYFTENISYQLDAAKRKGMALFLEKLQQISVTGV